MRVGSLRITRRVAGAIAMVAMSLVLVRTACMSWSMGAAPVALDSPAAFASVAVERAGAVAPCCAPGGGCAGSIAQSACGDPAEAGMIPAPMAFAQPLVAAFDVPALPSHEPPPIFRSFHQRSARIRV